MTISSECGESNKKQKSHKIVSRKHLAVESQDETKQLIKLCSKEKKFKFKLQAIKVKQKYYFLYF